MELAMESLPESFGRVHMLYIDVEIQDVPMKAFVDSGAEMTIMSRQYAEKVGIMRLLDTRFHGEARGVGTSKILGRVHIAQMKFGSTYLPISITVLENNDMDFLFGLDNLRRYNCIIDLGRNVLKIGSEEVPFLSEYDTGKTALFSANERRAEAEAISKAGGGGNGSGSGGSSSSASSVPTESFTSTSTGDSLSKEEKLSQLEALGFPRGEAELALTQADGDVNLAATLLFSSR